MEKESGRIAVFDFLRAVAIMYIIGVRHIDDYASGFFHCKVDDILTYSFLGLFIFISGFLLNTNNNLGSKTDVFLFFKKRFFRIYPLYIIAVFLFYLGGLTSFKGFLLGAVFLNTIVIHTIPTLWFVSVICVYYLLFPLLVWKYKASKMLLIFSSIMFVLIAFHNQFNLIDYRLIIFFPAFVGGVYFSKLDTPILILTGRFFLQVSIVIFFISSVLFFVFDSNSIRFVFLCFFVSTSIPIIFYLSNKIPWIVDAAFFKKIAYAAFSMYLFHRLIFHAVIFLYKPESDIAILIYLYVVAIPLIYYFSYFTQLYYDKILKTFFSNKVKPA